MLLVCPSCRTRYVVPDSAIGVTGRQVRCANCKHSWYQDGAPLLVPPAPSIVAPVQTEAVSPPVAVSPPPSPPNAPMFAEVARSEPDAVAFSARDIPTQNEVQGDDEVPQPSEALPTPSYVQTPSFAETPAPPPPPVADYDDGPSRFAHEPPFKARRNPAKLWTMAAIGFAAFVALLGIGLWYFGVPTGNFSGLGKEPDLKIVLNPNLELNEKADGTPYFIASGSIVNPTSSDQKVPDMLITLKDRTGRPVYSWKIKAKTRNLAPGAKAEFSEAKLDVPLAASKISATWVLSGG